MSKICHPNLVLRFSLLPSLALSRSVRTGRREPWERGCCHPCITALLEFRSIHNTLQSTKFTLCCASS